MNGITSRMLLIPVQSRFSGIQTTLEDSAFAFSLLNAFHGFVYRCNRISIITRIPHFYATLKTPLSNFDLPQNRVLPKQALDND